MSRKTLWELMAKKLSGEASPDELRDLEEQLKANPEIHYPIQTVADIWHQPTPDTEDAHAAFARHAARMNELGTAFEPDTISSTNEPTFSKRKYVLLSLTLVLLFSAGYYYWSSFYVPAHQVKMQADKSEVSTKYGSRTNLLLPDGTQVWLNSGSKLSYDKTYGNTNREVVLSGEAYFDVVKNAARPFVIHAAGIDIKVLGTAFNVKSFPNEKNTETSLIRGSIEVTFKNRPAEKIILKPNEKLITANEEPLKDSLQSAAAAENTTAPANKDAARQEPLVLVSHLTYALRDSTVVETSWMENKLIFRSESFEALAVKMERWYGMRIRFADEAIKPRRLTGTFENESMQQAMKALQLITPFTYTIDKNEVMISSK